MVDEHSERNPPAENSNFSDHIAFGGDLEDTFRDDSGLVSTFATEKRRWWFSRAWKSVVRDVNIMLSSLKYHVSSSPQYEPNEEPEDHLRLTCTIAKPLDVAQCCRPFLLSARVRASYAAEETHF